MSAASKWLAGLLAGLAGLACLALAGCGGGEEEDPRATIPQPACTQPSACR